LYISTDKILVQSVVFTY